jgi:hypothetical protein
VSHSNYFDVLDEEAPSAPAQKLAPDDVGRLFQLKSHSQPLLKEFLFNMLPPKDSMVKANGAPDMDRKRHWKATSLRFMPGTTGDFLAEIAYAGRVNQDLSRHFMAHIHIRPQGGGFEISRLLKPGNVKLTIQVGAGGHEAWILSRKACAALVARALKDVGNGVSITPGARRRNFSLQTLVIKGDDLAW